MRPVEMSSPARGPSSVEIVALHARFDPSLESLRAGSIDTPARFSAIERSELASAQERNASLDAMRGGGEPSNNEWKWLAIGAGIVLLIVLL
jgi:hypothetical protein